MLIFPSFFNAGPATYEIEQSLRFDGSSTGLTRSAFGASDNSTTWTLSLWFKRGKDLITHVTQEALVWSEPPSGTTNSGNVELFYDNRYPARTHRVHSTWSNTTFAYTDGTQRDHSAWYHLVIKCTGTTGTSGTVVYYINGRQAHSSTVPEAYMFGNPRVPRIGSRTAGSYFSGYMAEFHYVHGIAKDATDFGEFDNNGVWRPKRYTGTYGTNGFYLKFDPSATNGIGHDHSGNGNNFTASGFTTSGTGTDVMSDTPTNNFCTWNPLDNTGVTLNNGNLDFGYAGANDCGGTFALTSGKWYWEIECRTNIGTGGQPLAHGIHNASVTSDFRKQAIWFYTDEISAGVVRRYANNSVAASVSIPSALRAIDIGDYLQVAYDADSGEVWFAVNNTWMDGSGGTSGNPGSGSNPVFTLPDTSIPMTPWRSHAGLGWEGFTNFGQRDFQYTPPTGFKALNTANLPAPTVKDGSEYFDTDIYTGNSSTNSRSNFSFSPNFVWIKSRTGADSHLLFDSVRGATKFLYSNSTQSELTNANTLTSFDTNGFTLGNDGSVNNSVHNYAAWAWDAGGSGSSNTDGSITSTVSANPTAGFSIVSYTGNNTNGATVGHGLGVEPAMVIIKARTALPDGRGRWIVLHKGAASISSYSSSTTFTLTSYTNALLLDTNSSNINYSFDDQVNGSSSNTYIAYCFAEVEGYSKFGSYTGNSSTDGSFVYCGFKPRWVMVKRTDATGYDWEIFDSARGTYNVIGPRLWANLSSAETSATRIDFVSNGFKLRDSGGQVNGGTIIFAAFAENPFGGSGVSPATAR